MTDTHVLTGEAEAAQRLRLLATDLWVTLEGVDNPATSEALLRLCQEIELVARDCEARTS